jgi:hypothetical protein
MAEEKKLIGRGGMVIDERGHNRVLGYWPDNLNPNGAPGGWVAQTYGAYKELLNIAQPLSEQNHALNVAKQSGRPPPELPEPAVREKRARQNLKRLEKIQENLVKV